MAPKKTPSKREPDPHAGSTSHGSSKQETNETNAEQLPLGDLDDESSGVKEGEVASVWTRPPQYVLLHERKNEAAPNTSAPTTDRPSLKPTAQDKMMAERAAMQAEAERQHMEQAKQARDHALKEKARLEATKHAAMQAKPSQAFPPNTWRPGESRFGAMTDEAKALYEASEQAARGEAIHRGIFEDEQDRLEVERARRADSFARPQHWPEHFQKLRTRDHETYNPTGPTRLKQYRHATIPHGREMVTDTDPGLLWQTASLSQFGGGAQSCGSG